MTTSLDTLGVQTLNVSTYAALAAVIILIARRLAGRRLSPPWRCALWLLVLARLLLPVTPQTRWSPSHALSLLAPSPAKLPAPQPIQISITYAPPQSLPYLLGQQAMMPTPSAQRPSHSIRSPAWLAIALFLLARVVIANVLLARRLARAKPITSSDTISLLDACKSQLSLSRRIRLVETDVVATPALAGLFRPTILLPIGLLQRTSTDDLRFVLLHELAHVKRHDLAIDWLWALATAVHWFNPLAWLAASCFRADREVARDRMVLHTSPNHPPQRYGQALLACIESVAPHTLRRRLATLGLVGVLGLGSHRRLRQRFAMIASFASTSPSRRPAAAILGLLLLTLIGCSTFTKPISPPAQGHNNDAFLPKFIDLPNEDPSALSTRVHDIRDLITEIPDFVPDAKPTTGAGESRPAAAPDPDADRQRRIHMLITLLRDTIDPNSWQPAPSASGAIRELGGQLSIIQTNRNHQAIVRLLEQLRETRGIQILLEVRFITLSDDAVKSLPEDLRKHLQPAPPEAAAPNPARPKDKDFTPTYLDDQQVNQILKANAARVATAPHILLYNGQRAFVKAGTQTAYLADYTLVKDDAGQTRYEPSIQVVDAGVVFDAQATVSADRKYVTLTLRPKITELLSMEEKPYSKSPPDQKLTTQKPVIASHELSMTVSLPNNGTLLAGYFNLANAKAQNTYLLVKPTIIQQREAKPAEKR